MKMKLESFVKKIMRWLNKKGVSATVIGIILIVVGFALVVIFIIFAGKQSGEKVNSIVDSLSILRRGGA